jgi:hypothetical protein
MLSKVGNEQLSIHPNPFTQKAVVEVGVRRAIRR